MRRSWVAIIALIVLVVVVVDEAAACSIARVERLVVHCGGQHVILSGGTDGAGTNTSRSEIELRGAFDSLGDACGESPADLERFFDAERKRWEGLDRTFVRWSPEAEASIAREHDTPRYGECYYQGFRRVGAWMLLEWHERPYCFDSGAWGTCPSVEFSPMLFAGYIARERIRDAMPLLPMLALALVLAIGALVLRRQFVPSLRPMPATVAVALTALASWLWLRSGGDVAQLRLRDPQLWRDLVVLGPLIYVVVSLLAHPVRRIALRRAGQRGAA